LVAGSCDNDNALSSPTISGVFCRVSSTDSSPGSGVDISITGGSTSAVGSGVGSGIGAGAGAGASKVVELKVSVCAPMVSVVLIVVL